jgi:hypothetical protein
MATHTDSDQRSLADLIRDLRDESTVLLRQEVALAKTELTEKAAKVGRNTAYLVVGGAIALLGANFLLMAVSAGMTVAINSTEWEPHGVWIAPLIVGIVVGVIAASMVSKAQNALRHVSVIPEKTIETLREDKQWAQAKVQ